ncbi:putative vacuolar protein sorting-associated protein-3 [Elsinoe australis]|uniref:Putative vacuolar protein sorting-associated protein-3 n=1 Tax=Elsinoe australis TaxID=40998 RepID=A0A4V6DUA3_9PEZI|nr:putative vacuolar protein sorting-associated protein-3 [Elsinoe australis]
MGNNGSHPKITAQDKAILDMKNQRDKLRQYQKKITILTDRETEIARECLRTGDKRKALLALRKKKYQQSLLEQTDAQLAQLETLTADVEFALVQKDVLFGLQQGTSVLKQINKEMGGLEKVEQLMADNEEAREYQREVSDMLVGQMSNADEDDVEDELAALEKEMGVGQKDEVSLPGTEGLVDPMPDAPKETPKQRAERRQRDREAERGEPIAA